MINQNLGFDEEDFIGQEKSARRKDMAGAFAGWLNSMSINPDPNLPQVLQAAQLKRADKIKGNRTVNMLEKAGRTDLADMVKAGTLDPKQAAAQLFAEAGERRAFERQKELARFQAGLKGTKDTALIRNAIAAGLKEGTPEFKRYITSGGDIYSQETALLANLPKPPTGMNYEFERGASGEVTGYKLVPMRGSKQEREAVQAAEAAQAAEAGQLKTAGIIAGNIDAIQEKLKTSTLPIAGFAGFQLSKIAGTEAYDVKALTETIKANIGFDKLQAMRDASPTGGALGQVSNQEISFLQSTLNNLDQAQSQAQFAEQLDILERQYNETMKKFSAYPEEARRLAGFTYAPAAQQQPAAGGAKVIRYDAEGNRIN